MDVLVPVLCDIKKDKIGSNRLGGRVVLFPSVKAERFAVCCRRRFKENCRHRLRAANRGIA